MREKICERGVWTAGLSLEVVILKKILPDVLIKVHYVLTRGGYGAPKID